MPRVFLILATLTAQASACLWDRDTLAEEAKGRGDLVKIIVGWFDRYPPRYYEMRLERVSKELQENPNDLELLDDAAVACDRLGRPDEAIDWMEKKKTVLNALPSDESPEHHYRYLANLGTFYAHRWISKPESERNADLSDLRTGEKLIAQAIEENPEAHFGREIHQLNAIRWMLWDGDDNKLGIDPVTGIEFGRDSWVSPHYSPLSNSADHQYPDGISGLIKLGAAWQNIDAFHALTGAMEYDELTSLAQLSYQREIELFETGARSIHPVYFVRERVYPDPPQLLQNRKPVDEYYKIARAATTQRNQSWIAYQNELFDKGLHPDTHPDFWANWIEPAFPAIPGPSLFDQFKTLLKNRLGLVASILIVTVAIFVVLFADFIRRRRFKALASQLP
ncbi:hypothetical protein ACFQY0_15260 [Haloferula chungangensis]|uniref:Tetratricopeptide repeat protein n=1 Tax=Haloferula chungangensis TaxID=1048331 RepID=A0ABW2LC48_9BACT